MDRKAEKMTDEELRILFTHEHLAPIYLGDEYENIAFVMCLDCGYIDCICVEDLLAYAKQSPIIPEKEEILFILTELVESINRK